MRYLTRQLPDRWVEACLCPGPVYRYRADGRLVRVASPTVEVPATADEACLLREEIRHGRVEIIHRPRCARVHDVVVVHPVTATGGIGARDAGWALVSPGRRVPAAAR